MTLLYLVSTFPALTQTFTLRAIRQLRDEGLDVIVGELRPLRGTPAAQGFEDLSSLVLRARWIDADLLKALMFFAALFPGRLLACLKLAWCGFSRPKYWGQIVYIMLAAIRLAYRLRSADVGLVQAGFLHSEALAARFCSTLMRRPYALVVYTVFTHYPTRLLGAIVQGATFLVADTSQVQEYLLARYDISEKCIAMIRNGVSLEELAFRRNRQVDGNLILAAASLYPKKGLHVLLCACAVLKERGIPFRCVLAGDGYERRRLEGLRGELGLTQHVEIIGYVSMSELKEWYYKANVFAMPSVISDDGQTDGLPTVLIEACATGLPVIGSCIGGIPEIIREGKNGFLVAPNDANSLADRLQFLLEHRDVREQMGLCGRALVEQEFDLRRNVSQMCELIHTASISSTVAPCGNHEKLVKTGTWR